MRCYHYSVHHDLVEYWQDDIVQHALNQQLSNIAVGTSLKDLSKKIRQMLIIDISSNFRHFHNLLTIQLFMIYNVFCSKDKCLSL